MPAPKRQPSRATSLDGAKQLEAAITEMKIGPLAYEISRRK
jgi:hypothetical protein